MSKKALVVDLIITTILYIFCIVWMQRANVSGDTFWPAVIFVGIVILVRIYNGFLKKKK